MMLPKRKSPRIPNYDYSTKNYYFVTICTYNKECIFGNPGILNEYGRIAEAYLLKIPEIYQNFRIDKYVIMPNHVHVIFDVDDAEQKKSLSYVIGQYKTHVSKEIHKSEVRKNLWQRSFHDHVIRSEQSYKKIWEYIDNNPIKWELDCFYPKE